MPGAGVDLLGTVSRAVRDRAVLRRDSADACGGESTITEDLRAAEEAFRRADRELIAWRGRRSLSDLSDTYVAGLRTRVERRDVTLEALDQARVRAGVADLPEATELEAVWPSLSM